MYFLGLDDGTFGCPSVWAHSMITNMIGTCNFIEIGTVKKRLVK